MSQTTQVLQFKLALECLKGEKLCLEQEECPHLSVWVSCNKFYSCVVSCFGFVCLDFVLIPPPLQAKSIISSKLTLQVALVPENSSVFVKRSHLEL